MQRPRFSSRNLLEGFDARAEPCLTQPKIGQIGSHAILKGAELGSERTEYLLVEIPYSSSWERTRSSLGLPQSLRGLTM